MDNLSILMLRFYTTKPPPSPWGGVDPPVITYSDDWGKSWKELQPCDEMSRHLFNRCVCTRCTPPFAPGGRGRGGAGRVHFL